MSEPRVSALHSVDLGVGDLDAATAFFTDVWGLTLVARDNASSHLRGTGPFHHILALHRRPRAEILRINLLAAERAGVGALYACVADGGAVHADSNRAIVRVRMGLPFRGSPGMAVRVWDRLSHFRP